MILLSVELEESDVDAQVLSQLPRQDKLRSIAFKKPRGKFITPPIYPREARGQGLEGATVVRVTIDITGKPTNIGISQATGYPILDQQALITVKEWRFFFQLKKMER